MCVMKYDNGSVEIICAINILTFRDKNGLHINPCELGRTNQNIQKIKIVLFESNYSPNML